MHTIDLLEEAVQLAQNWGWQVRYEWLDGARGGACRLGAKHLLFVDRSLTAAEQLSQVIGALRDCGPDESSLHLAKHHVTSSYTQPDVSADLRKLLGLPDSSALEV